MTNLKLSDIRRILEIRLVEEGSFTTLGMLSQKEKIKSLTYIESPALIDDFQRNPGISAVICRRDMVEKIRCIRSDNLGIAVSNNPKRDFILLHNYLANEKGFYGKKQRSKIANNAQIHSSAFVAKQNVIVGENVIIEPHATILENVQIGDDSIIRSNAVIGSEGFEHKRIGNEIISVKHDGWVIIGSRVEVDANTAIAKGVYGSSTTIGDDSKFDQLIHVAHNVKVGKRCLITAGVTLAGSCEIGDDAWIGPGAVISSQIKIGNGAVVTIGSVVTRNVPDNHRVTGNWAIDHQKFIKFIKKIR